MKQKLNCLLLVVLLTLFFLGCSAKPANQSTGQVIGEPKVAVISHANTEPSTSAAVTDTNPATKPNAITTASVKPQPNTPPKPSTAQSSPASQEVKVLIQGFAFSPQTITVKSGTIVTWTNEDSAPHKVASDPHPSHTDLPGLVSGSLAKGESYSFTFVKIGTFGYHCHFHPSMKGTVIVEP